MIIQGIVMSEQEARMDMWCVRRDILMQRFNVALNLIQNDKLNEAQIQIEYIAQTLNEWGMELSGQ